MNAWGDESVRVVCTPPVYLLAATYRTDGGDIDATPLERLKPKGANKLHWREMGDKTKMRSAWAVAELEASHTIVPPATSPRTSRNAPGASVWKSCCVG